MSKYNCGNTNAACMKRRRVVTKKFSDKLVCNNVLRLITLDDFGKHDFTADCQQWQVGLQSFKKVLCANDMLKPFLIPETLYLTDSTLTWGPFINLIDDFHKVSEETAQQWQQYLLKHAAPVELESAS